MTVGQDLVRLELGGAPAEGKKEEKAESEPKEPASKEQSTSSDPEPKKEESKPKEESSAAPKQEKKPEPKKESPPPKSDSKSAAPTLGNREERRVSVYIFSSRFFAQADTCVGQDEPYAPAYCRETEAVSEHGSLLDHLQ